MILDYLVLIYIPLLSILLTSKNVVTTLVRTLTPGFSFQEKFNPPIHIKVLAVLLPLSMVFEILGAFNFYFNDRFVKLVCISLLVYLPSILLALVYLFAKLSKEQETMDLSISFMWLYLTHQVIISILLFAFYFVLRIIGRQYASIITFLENPQNIRNLFILWGILQVFLFTKRALIIKQLPSLLKKLYSCSYLTLEFLTILSYIGGSYRLMLE